MVATLPRNIQLKLEQALSQWRQWRCDAPLPHKPVITSLLNPGSSNHSVLVEAGQRFVVRIDGIKPSQNSLSRSTEWRALHTAHAAQLAPAPRYFNPELGVLVCDYLVAEEGHPDPLAGIATLLRGIHQLPSVHYRLDLRERIVRYEHQVKQRYMDMPVAMTSCHSEVLTLLDELQNESEPPVFCHNDLLGANRIYSENQLWAIDWEYCAMGSAWFDLAVVAAGDSLNVEQKNALVSSYLGRSANDEENLRLGQYCAVYQYLEILWYLANKGTPEDLKSRAELLQKTISLSYHP